MDTYYKLAVLSYGEVLVVDHDKWDRVGRQALEAEWKRAVMHDEYLEVYSAPEGFRATMRARDIHGLLWRPIEESE